MYILQIYGIVKGRACLQLEEGRWNRPPPLTNIVRVKVYFAPHYLYINILNYYIELVNHTTL